MADTHLFYPVFLADSLYGFFARCAKDVRIPRMMLIINPTNQFYMEKCNGHNIIALSHKIGKAQKKTAKGRPG
jgi:hypothetical protein